MASRKILFLYWGRRGITRLTRDILDAFERRADVPTMLSLSRQNPDSGSFADLGRRLVLVDTFATGLGAACLWRVLAIRSRIAEIVRTESVTDVVTLMPHVWSSLVSGAARAAGARYHTILHDAAPHPGDMTGLVLSLLLRDAKGADTVFALSSSVAEDIRRMGHVRDQRLALLFHPATGEAIRTLPAPASGEPWRFLFLGRIMAYKGLDLFVDMAERLRQEGRHVMVSVMGEGALGAAEAPLRQMGATIVNRWLDETEIASALGSHHAVVLSHIEASQSGVAATALGAGIPVLATPVGALREQVRHGETGLLATSVSAVALADAARLLMDTPGLHARLSEGAFVVRLGLSADAFVGALLAALPPLDQRVDGRGD